jgi:hypothetical protein
MAVIKTNPTAEIDIAEGISKRVASHIAEAISPCEKPNPAWP